MEALGPFFISKTKFLSFVLDLVGWIIKDMDTKEKYEFSKIYLAEYCHFDVEDDVSINQRN